VLPSPPTVLLLDDFPDTTEAVAIWLACEGWRPIRATRVEEALLRLDAEHIDAIVMEPYLRAGSAMAVAVAARRRYSGQILLVSMSANGRAGDNVAYEPTLFNANLLKPVPMETLMRVLSRAAPKSTGTPYGQVTRPSGTGIARSAHGDDVAASSQDLAGGPVARSQT